MLKIVGVLLLSLVFLLTFPGQIYAHAFGQLYNLPVPFWMYLYGGAAAIVASFLVIGYFLNKTTGDFSYPTLDLSKYTSFFVSSLFVAVIKSVSLLLFFLVVFGGLIGADDSRQNFNMTFFWIIFALGFSYLTAVAGNVWSIANPWKILVEICEKLTKRKVEGKFSYPKGLGYYPAFIFYFFFIWIELFARTTPFTLSLFLLLYTIINFVGAWLYGKSSWFRYCEFFGVFFRLISKMAPIALEGGKVYLRPPLVGLLKEEADHFSFVLFVLFMLSSTAFDGFLATGAWIKFSQSILEPVIGLLIDPNSYSGFQLMGTVGLLLSPFVFLHLYLTLVAVAKFITKSKFGIKELATKFAFSLVPIAFVYNVAHYYTLILTEGQGMFRLISDPLGFGWNLFGNANYQVNYKIINANIGWHSQVALILAGHISGVYLAHIIALKVFPSRKNALLSQLPMLSLMVIYTMIGLWILAQPIVAG